jgi:hypothetical protein
MSSIYFGRELKTHGSHGLNPSEEERRFAAEQRRRMRAIAKIEKMYDSMVECLRSEAEAYLKVQELNKIWQEKKAELLSLGESASAEVVKCLEDSAVDAKDKLEEALRAWLIFVDEARRQEKVVRAYEKAQKAQEAQ